MAWSVPRTWLVGEVVTAAMMNAHVRDQMNALSPIGKIEYFMRAPTSGVETLINGAWLELNGFAVSRTTYAGLDALLAALTPARPFGAGNGTTTVNLPDAAGRSLVHIDNASRTGGKADTIGKTFGVHAYALSIAELAAHGHSMSGSPSFSDPTHGHSFNSYITVPSAISGTGGGRASSGDSGQPVVNAAGTGASVGIGSLSAGSNGSGSAHENMPPGIAAGVWAVKAL